MYANLSDYGTGRNVITWNKGAALAPVTYISAHTATYTDSQPPKTVPVYKVALTNGKQYYVGKSLVAGLAGLNGVPTLSIQ